MFNISWRCLQVTAYCGGVSDYWRPFLKLLAQESQAAEDGWVKWSQLHDALGLTGIEGAGMLGAAERRCAGKVPYQKAFEEGEYWFRMPPPSPTRCSRWRQKAAEQTERAAGAGGTTDSACDSGSCTNPRHKPDCGPRRQRLPIVPWRRTGAQRRHDQPLLLRRRPGADRHRRIRGWHAAVQVPRVVPVGPPRSVRGRLRGNINTASQAPNHVTPPSGVSRVSRITIPSGSVPRIAAMITGSQNRMIAPPLTATETNWSMVGSFPGSLVLRTGPPAGCG